MPNTSSAHQRTLKFWLRSCTNSQVEHSSYVGPSVIELSLVEFSIDTPEPSLMSFLEGVNFSLRWEEPVYEQKSTKLPLQKCEEPKDLPRVRLRTSTLLKDWSLPNHLPSATWCIRAKAERCCPFWLCRCELVVRLSHTGVCTTTPYTHFPHASISEC